MRLSDLLDLDVEASDGRRLGFVADVRLVQDGPMLGPYGDSFRVAGLIVVEKRHLRLLGYERDTGPWLIRATIHWLTGDVRYVEWLQIQEITDRSVVLGVSDGQVGQLHDQPSRFAGAAE
jgi:hypothetical protein